MNISYLGHYYTDDHDWVDFQRSVVFTGVGSFKLTGIKEIHDIIFTGFNGHKKKGDLIGTIKYIDYSIDVSMPVDGILVDYNNELISGDRNILLRSSDFSCWIAMIIPKRPYENWDLIPQGQYRQNMENKYSIQIDR